jgi:secreted protein with Ig-like and vWFA domain
MTEPITFDVTVYQNEYLPAGERVMDALVSVTATGRTAAPPAAAEVIMIDRSSSMAGARLVEAKRATTAALDALRDEVAFAIVAGNAGATMVYPAQPRMVPATAETREAARAAVARLEAQDGTAIGTWLALANRLLAGERAEIKHGILLTDGHNEHQTPEDLRRVLEDCRGRFVCDCRGVGDGWEAKPLLEIADVLLGSAAGLREPGELAEDFRAITGAVMGKAAANVALRLWTLPDVRVRMLKQVHPRIVDLTGRGVVVDDRNVDYPTGQWGTETRDFQLSLDVPVGALDEEIRAAKVGMVAGEQASEGRLVRVRWTADPALSTKINPRVAHYAGQTELSEAIEDGIAARDAGDELAATAKLGRAVQLAHSSGHEVTLRVLSRVVDVVDAPSGTVRLRPDIAPVDAELAELSSRTTVGMRRRSGGNGVSA